MARSSTPLVATYTIVHGLAEFLTALVIFSSLSSWTGSAGQLIAYNAMAFGGPVIVVLLAGGRFRHVAEGWIGLAGTALLAGGMLFGRLGWVCVLVLGCGSALFHIAAGTAALKMPNPGTAVGVFESSGAFGLALGGLLGIGAWQGIADTAWVGLGVAAILAGGCAVLVWGTARGASGLGAVVAMPAKVNPAWTVQAGTGLVPMIALAGLVAVSLARSMVVFGTADSWKQGVPLVLGAALAVSAGRAVGGLLTDRVGITATAVAGLVAAAVLLGVWPAAAWAGVLGGFCLALPMAPVIVALATSLGRPAFAFGLAQLCQVAALVTAVRFGRAGVLIALLACAGVILCLRPLFKPASTACAAATAVMPVALHRGRLR